MHCEYSANTHLAAPANHFQTLVKQCDQKNGDFVVIETDTGHELVAAYSALVRQAKIVYSNSAGYAFGGLQ